MRPVVLDFETYFGDDYTLSKMTQEAYTRDPRVQHMIAAEYGIQQMTVSNIKTRKTWGHVV